jgi:putative phosphoribosyl transferase
MMSKPFRNRPHAGKLLARALPAELRNSDALVLALPRGGVPVGYAVATELHLELDILMVRKLGLPGHEEFAMGALGSGGVRVIQPDILRIWGVSDATLEAICAREQAELTRRERVFRGARPAPQLQGRTVILVDDGLATGSTMRAAIEVARAGAPARIVVAVPVGAPDTCAALAPEVSELVCLVRPPVFSAVSTWYQQFEQTGDDEVQDLLALAWRSHPGRQHAASQASTNPHGGLP